MPGAGLGTEDTTVDTGGQGPIFKKWKMNRDETMETHPVISESRTRWTGTKAGRCDGQ